MCLSYKIGLRQQTAAGWFRVGSDKGWTAIQDSHTDKETYDHTGWVDARCTEDGV